MQQTNRTPFLVLWNKSAVSVLRQKPEISLEHIPATNQASSNHKNHRGSCLHHLVPYQSSSLSFFAIAFFLASSASAKLPARLGVGVLLRLPSEPLVPARLIPESRGCNAAGFRPGRAGGVGAAGLARPLATGGGGGARGWGAGAGAACSST